MIDFSLTEEQIALRTLVREFMEREVKPVLDELEQKVDPNVDPMEWFPWGIFEKAQEAGLRTLTLKKEYGGAEIDAVTTAILTEEVCASDVGIGVGFLSLWRGIQVLQWMGTKEQCDRYLPQAREDTRFTFAAAITEPDHGSDNMLPCPDPKGGAKLSAEIKGDEVVLNGMKHFISNGPVASLYFVYARTDRTKPIREGLTLFLVPRDAPGFSIGRVHDRMGWRLMAQSELIFENCRIPKANQMSGWNTASAELARLLRTSNAYTGAGALGVARACFEKALDYAKTRVQGTVPIIQHPNIAMRLGEMFVRIEAARHLIWRACWNAEREEYFDPRLVKAPKILASEVAKEVAISAMDIHGGLGVMKEVGMERLVRDALVFGHPDCLNDVLLIHIGRVLERGLMPERD